MGLTVLRVHTFLQNLGISTTYTWKIYLVSTMLFPRLHTWRLLLLLSTLGLQVAGLPLDDRSTPLERNISIASIPSTNGNLRAPMLDVPSLGDWEHFTYAIPNTKLILKGRMFPSRPLRESALHYMIDGGIAETTSHISTFGDESLRSEHNPFIYRVPGCHFKMSSKVSRGEATMSYRMMREVFLAFEQLLEKEEQPFETSFVLTDERRVTWGHGEVTEGARSPSPPLSDS